jgi:hypothetical protein
LGLDFRVAGPQGSGVGSDVLIDRQITDILTQGETHMSDTVTAKKQETHISKFADRTYKLIEVPKNAVAGDNATCPKPGEGLYGPYRISNIIVTENAMTNLAVCYTVAESKKPTKVNVADEIAAARVETATALTTVAELQKAMLEFMKTFQK